MEQPKIPNTINNPCAACGGYDSIERGIGKRCWGFRSGNYLYCSREDYSGWTFGKTGAPQTPSGLYKHRLAGICVCGERHWDTLGKEDNSSWIASDAGFNYHSASKEKKRDHFKKIWDESLPIKDTLAETYLKKRGITITSDELRFHPAISHSSTRNLHPTMIAANRLYSTQQIIGIQRTYLSEDGEKLQHTFSYQVANKMALGTLKQGAVWFKPPTEELGIAEGVETALSVMQVLNISVFASLGTGLMREIELPPLPLAKTIKIFSDGDYPGYISAKGSGEKWAGEGREVIYCPAPHGKDFNDMLKDQMK